MSMVSIAKTMPARAARRSVPNGTRVDSALPVPPTSVDTQIVTNESLRHRKPADAPCTLALGVGRTRKAPIWHAAHVGNRHSNASVGTLGLGIDIAWSTLRVIRDSVRSTRALCAGKRKVAV